MENPNEAKEANIESEILNAEAMIEAKEAEFKGEKRKIEAKMEAKEAEFNTKMEAKEAEFKEEKRKIEARIAEASLKLEDELTKEQQNKPLVEYLKVSLKSLEESLASLRADKNSALESLEKSFESRKAFL